MTPNQELHRQDPGNLAGQIFAPAPRFDLTLALGEVSLSGTDWGTRGLDPLYLFHGTGQTHHSFDEVGPALSQKFHAIGLDIRGHGKSSLSSSYAPYDCGEDMYKAANQLGHANPIIVGASISGLHALCSEHLHPGFIKHLVLVDILPSVSVDYTKKVSRVLKSSCFSSIEAAVSYFHKQSPSRDREVLRERLENSLEERSDGFRFKTPTEFIDQMCQDTNGKWWHLLEDLKCPVSLIRGGRSQALDADALERFRQLPNSGSIITVPFAGHSVAGDAPEEFSKALLSLL